MLIVFAIIVCNTVDVTTYNYDTRNRLTQINSLLYNETLTYDGNAPVVSNAAFAVTNQYNYNGNINGVSHLYKFNNSNVINYAATSGVMDNATVYGYAYDGLNRLQKADASVLNVLTGNATNYTPKLNYGDETMKYDKIGNISGLSRGLYYIPSTPTPANQFQNWAYSYALNKNQLMDIDSTNSQHLRDYTYDNNGNQRTQTINGINTATTTTTQYMRSNLVRSHNISSANNNQLSYEYNNHDDRVYKNTPTGSTYYLRDASGKELAMLNVTTNTWTHYAYGRERVAELSTGPATFYNYDHLGSVRVVYQADANCSRGKSLQYTIASANDYFPFGKTLRSFNSSKYAYQGSEKEKELSDNDYYTHFRELNTEIARWWQVDPKSKPQESPFVSMGNNPIMYNDIMGDTIVINLFGRDDIIAYHLAAKKAVLNQVDDGVFIVYGHGHNNAIEYHNSDGSPNAAFSGKQFNKMLMEKNPNEYGKAMEEGRKVLLILMSCNSASKEYVADGGGVFKTQNPIAKQISSEIAKYNSNSILVGADGYVHCTPKGDFNGVRQTNEKYRFNTNTGGFIKFKNGEEQSKIVVPFKGSNFEGIIRKKKF